MPGVSKSSALQHACVVLDIAFGDAQNDIPMFKIAGYCVAMGNACAELKNIASDVTLSNDEDGIAVALAKLGM